MSSDVSDFARSILPPAPSKSAGRRYRLIKDDLRMGLHAGGVLLCVPYFLDPREKLTVLERVNDGFDPECNVYRNQVEALDE